MKMGDGMSGIKSYKGYIDGKWVLFEYDQKSGTAFCNLSVENVEKDNTLKTFKFVVTEAPNDTAKVQQTRASSRLWNITDLAPSNIYTGGGYYIDLAFVLNSTYKYVHIDLDNAQPSTQRTRLRIYAGEDATDPVTSWITVVGGNYGYVFNDEPMTGTYFIRYSSDTAIDGSSYAYRGSSLSDVM